MVIVPYWNKESEYTSKELAKQIKILRDEFGYEPVYYVSMGDDIGLSIDDSLDELNDVNHRETSKLIEEINNEIEDIDKLDEEERKIRELNKLNRNKWFNKAN